MQVSNHLEEIHVHSKKDSLLLIYTKDKHELSAEFLRVYSPSAEVRGHGSKNQTLQTGKRWITIEDLEIVGNYALKISFSDGHNSGLYDWQYLRQLCEHQDELWQNYLHQLQQAGASREPTDENHPSNLKHHCHKQH